MCFARRDYRFAAHLYTRSIGVAPYPMRLARHLWLVRLVGAGSLVVADVVALVRYRCVIAPAK